MTKSVSLHLIFLSLLSAWAYELTCRHVGWRPGASLHRLVVVVVNRILFQVLGDSRRCCAWIRPRRRSWTMRGETDEEVDRIVTVELSNADRKDKYV
jgi:hypothetical protein